MRAVSRIGIVVIFLVMMFTVSAFGSATNIYITQSGSPTGNCTANVQTPAFFNSAANWGTGANQIGPGTTVLFCGTFTGTAGQSGFTFQGSGASGKPITLLFDTNAQMSAPYWGSASTGAINCSGRSYLIMDGGTSGIIQNTANGTSLANHQSSNGVYASNCTNIEIRNLAIQNIYLNQGSNSGATDTNGQNTADISLQGNSSGDSVHDNVLSNARTGLWVDFDSGHDASNLLVYNNTISDHPWSISMGACNASSTATNVKIYDNDISDWLNWQFPSSTYHTDGIILFNDADGGHICSGLAPIATFQVYNNYFHGSLGNGSATGYIACGERTSCYIFNNLMVDNGSYACYGYIWLYNYAGPYYIYNNTLVGSGGGIAVTTDGGSPNGGTYLENNIFTNISTSLHSYVTLRDDITSSDYNIFRNSSGSAPSLATNDSTYLTMSTWQSYGFDGSSVSADPKLSGTYSLQSGSPAIGMSTNLVSTGITALDSDKAGVARSSSGAWDTGAYTFGVVPAAPSGLTATVQ